MLVVTVGSGMKDAVDVFAFQDNERMTGEVLDSAALESLYEPTSIAENKYFTHTQYCRTPTAHKNLMTSSPPEQR